MCPSTGRRDRWRTRRAEPGVADVVLAYARNHAPERQYRWAANVVITSAEEFVRLRESEWSQDYQRAAHEEAPLEVWLNVVDWYPSMRFWVAQNKTVPIRVLEILARDTDPHVRGMVAAKRKLTPELQILLAGDPDDGVRDRLANNAKVTREALSESRTASLALLRGRPRRSWKGAPLGKSCGAVQPAVADGRVGRYAPSAARS